MAKATKVWVLSVTDGASWWVYGVYSYDARGTALVDAREYCDRQLYGEARDWKLEEVEIIK